MTDRLLQLNDHLVHSSASSFFGNVEEAPSDAIFALSSAYKNDSSSSKIDLSVGAYRTNDNNPWVLPSVYKAEQMILERRRILTSDKPNNTNKPNEDHEYLSIDGLALFNKLSCELLLGKGNEVIENNKTVTIQTISGTGANSLFANFMKRNGFNKIMIPNPTWGNHHNIMSTSGLQVSTYPYYNKLDNNLDFDNMIKSIEQASSKTIVLLHACAHNPTGIDPTRDQWKTIARVIEEKNLIAFFDCAYQGFASGDVEKDVFCIRYFAKRQMEFFVAQSYSKNFGLYGQRAGTLTALCKTKEIADKVRSQLKKLSRATISNPPKHGALIVSYVLGNQDLKEEWLLNLKTMANRIKSMRKLMHEGLLKLNTPGNWDHIINQIGMFTYTGLSKNQCLALKAKYHVYLTDDGRISMAGLNTHNVATFVKYVDIVVREIK